MRFTQLMLLLLTLLAVPAFAGPTDGFKSLQEFVEALDEMPAQTFKEFGEHTPQARLREWTGALQRLNPIFFEEWNRKLELLPSIGFNNGTSRWVLSAQYLPEVAPVGFRPDARQAPFENIVDFYKSLAEVSDDVVIERVNSTSREMIISWLGIVKRTNPTLFHFWNLRLAFIRQIGFQAIAAERTVVQPYPIFDPNIRVSGFLPGQADPALILTSYEEVESLVAATDISDAGQAKLLERRFQATGPETMTPWLLKLKFKKPEGFQKLQQVSEFRIAAGFRRAGQPAMELVSQRAPVVQIRGFMPDFDCDGAMAGENI